MAFVIAAVPVGDRLLGRRSGLCFSMAEAKHVKRAGEGGDHLGLLAAYRTGFEINSHELLIAGYH